MDRQTDAFPAPPEPLAPDLRSQWMLRPDVTFLNHGSFGAVPRVVFEEQERWRRRIEAEPVELLGRRHPEMIEAAKRPLAGLVGARPEEIGLVTNATEGINAVLGSLRLQPGDELLTTTHVYNAVRMAMRAAAGRAGATYREVDVRTPVTGARQIVETIVDRISDRTRLVVIDHVTSPTGLVFPVARIAAACADRGVDVLVDGAHAPGMLDLNLPALGATWYAGNLHKWTCAPKGCGFVWARPDRAGELHPTVISHNFGQGLAAEFNWQGTRDTSAWLTIPTALEFMSALGWERVRRHNHDLATWAHRMLVERFGVEPVTPLDGSLLGATATVRLPGRLASLDEKQTADLQQDLYTTDRIEVPLVPWQGALHLRVSCQVYNRPEDYHRLADVILRRAEDAKM
jgi:isopenicillin-N epimerase